MNSLIEQRINALYQKTAHGLITLIDADVALRVKLAAAASLARCRVQAARDKVVEFFQAHPLEEDAIGPMAEVGGEIAERLLIARVRDPLSPSRDLVAERLGLFKSAAALGVLKELLGDRDRHVRWQAINGLAAIGGKEAALALCRYISDPDEWISMLILKLLGRMKEPESIPYLTEQFGRETDVRRKAQMVNFLAMFRNITLVNIFDECLRNQEVRIKANAIEAFADLELPPREVSTRISPYLEAPNNRIRANAILALSRSEPERIRPHLVKMVESEDMHLRRSAAFILGRIPPEGNEELASTLIGDSSVDVRRRMVLSLRNFPTLFARDQLEKGVADRHPWIRKHSIDLATGYPDFPATPILHQLRDETAAPNLVACMNFFSRHPVDEASRLIRQRVKDKREMVVSAAIRAIGAIQGISGLQQFAPQIDFYDHRVLRTFSVTQFGLGSVETFDSVLEKAVQQKKSHLSQNTHYLSALEGCLELLDLGAKMPAGLEAKLGSMPEVQIQSAHPSVTERAAVRVGEGKTPVADLVPPGAATAATADLDRKHAVGTEEPARRIRRKAAPEIPRTFLLGRKKYNLGQYGKARKYFRKSLETHPKLDKAHFYLGMIAFEWHEYEQARNALEIFLERHPDHLGALSVLVRLDMAAGDWSGVVRLAPRILGFGEKVPARAAIRVQRDFGMAHLFLGNAEQARSILESVSRFVPKDFVTGYHLARAYLDLGETRNAENLLLEMETGLPDGGKRREMVEALLDRMKGKPASGAGVGGWPRPAVVAAEAPAPAVAEIPVNGPVVNEPNADEPVAAGLTAGEPGLPETAPEPAPEVVPDLSLETASEAMREVAPESALTAAPEVASGAASETMREIAPESAFEAVREAASEPALKTAPEVASKPVPEAAPDVMPEVAPNVAPGVPQDAASEAVLDVGSEAAPEAASETAELPAAEPASAEPLPSAVETPSSECAVNTAEVALPAAEAPAVADAAALERADVVQSSAETVEAAPAPGEIEPVVAWLASEGAMKETTTPAESVPFAQPSASAESFEPPIADPFVPVPPVVEAAVAELSEFRPGFAESALSGPANLEPPVTVLPPSAPLPGGLDLGNALLAPDFDAGPPAAPTPEGLEPELGADFLEPSDTFLEALDTMVKSDDEEKAAPVLPPVDAPVEPSFNAPAEPSVEPPAEGPAEPPVELPADPPAEPTPSSASASIPRTVAPEPEQPIDSPVPAWSPEPPITPVSPSRTGQMPVPRSPVPGVPIRSGSASPPGPGIAPAPGRTGQMPVPRSPVPGVPIRSGTASSEGSGVTASPGRTGQMPIPRSPVPGVPIRPGPASSGTSGVPVSPGRTGQMPVPRSPVPGARPRQEPAEPSATRDSETPETPGAPDLPPGSVPDPKAP